MAQRPVYRQINHPKEEKDLHKWAGEVSNYLNEFNDKVVNALNSGLDVSNLNVSYKEFEFTTSSTYTGGTFSLPAFSSGITGTPVHVSVAQITQIEPVTVITTSVSLDWSYNSGSITINYISGLQNSKKYKLRVRVE